MGLRGPRWLYSPGDDTQRWDDGSGRIAMDRSKTDIEAPGAIIPAAMCALGTINPVDSDGDKEHFRAVGVPDRPAGEGCR